jgi:hypothetical protein
MVRWIQSARHTGSSNQRICCWSAALPQRVYRICSRDVPATDVGANHPNPRPRDLAETWKEADILLDRIGGILGLVRRKFGPLPDLSALKGTLSSNGDPKDRARSCQTIRWPETVLPNPIRPDHGGFANSIKPLNFNSLRRLSTTGTNPGAR